MIGVPRNSSQRAAVSALAWPGALGVGAAVARDDIRLVAHEGELLELAGEWNRLVDRSRQPSVFLRHEWFEAAWQWRRSDASLFVLGWYRDGALASVLPLVLRREGAGPAAIRALEFLAVPDAQLCDLIVGAGDEVAASQAFIRALEARRGAWDILRLRGLPRGAMGAALADAFRDRRFIVAALEPDRNLYVPLSDSWDAYYGTRTRSLKKANNLAANRLQKAGEVSIRWIEPGTRPAAKDVEHTVATCVGISARSWKGNIDTGLDKPGPQAFIRRLSERAAERGWLSVWTVSLDGRPVAMEYQLVADGNVYALRADFDAACETISPGSHLSRQLLERMFGRGLQRYYMGPGENPYKLRWTDQGEALDEVWIYGRTMRGRAVALWERLLKPALRTVRDAIRRKREAPAGTVPEKETQ